MERMLPKMYKDILGIVSVLWMVSFPHQVVAEESLCHLDFLPQPYSLEEEVGKFVWEFPKVHSQWKVDLNETKEWKKFLHQKPKGTPRIRQPGLVPSAGTLELQPGGETEAPASKRHTEVLELPKVDRRAPATPTVRPGGESSTPATGKSRAERKQEKKTARKEEKTARKEEKRNRRAKQAEQAEEQEEKPEGTPQKTPVRRKLDAAMESAGTIESVLLLEKEYKALKRDPSHKPNFYFLIDRLISNLRHIPRTVYGPPAGEEERIKLMELRKEEEV